MKQIDTEQKIGNDRNNKCNLNIPNNQAELNTNVQKDVKPEELGVIKFQSRDIRTFGKDKKRSTSFNTASHLNKGDDVIIPKECKKVGLSNPKTKISPIPLKHE